MIRLAPRSVRVGAALVGVTAAVTLAGCTGTDTAASTDTGDAEQSSGGASTSEGYVDGTYTAEGSYATPESVETISVTLTIADDVVTDVEVTGDPQARESEEYQSQFIGGISNEVVGKNVDDVSVSRVAGSSLTSGGFMQALDEIKQEAAA